MSDELSRKPGGFLALGERDDEQEVLDAGSSCITDRSWLARVAAVVTSEEGSIA
jgi:hypothetical protein